MGVFIDVLTRHSLPMLAVIFEQYSKVGCVCLCVAWPSGVMLISPPCPPPTLNTQQLCDYDIEKSISRETSYNLKRALLAVVSAVRDPSTYYAHRLHLTMAGAGTQDRNLIRIIVRGPLVTHVTRVLFPSLTFEFGVLSPCTYGYRDCCALLCLGCR